jgi:hypothetical protein
MMATVKSTFTRTAASSRPTSSADWSYCAFIEQLLRVAEQLSATIDGVLVGSLVCEMFDISLQVSSTAVRT